MRSRRSLLCAVGSLLLLVACTGDSFAPVAPTAEENGGAGGQAEASGAAGSSGEPAGQAGTTSDVAGAAGSPGAGGGVATGGTAGNGGGGAPPCPNKPVACADGTPPPLGCVSDACEDVFCTSTCELTQVASELKAKEICRDGICWMMVRRLIGSRTEAISACKGLGVAGESRKWVPAYFVNDAELQKMLAAALFGIDAAANKALWIDALWQPATPSTPAAWTQPEGPLGAPSPPIAEPAKAFAGEPRGAKITRAAGDPIISVVDPSAGNAGVLCRPLP